MAARRGGYEGTLEARAGGDEGERGAALAGQEGLTQALLLRPALSPRTGATSWLHWAASSGNLRQLRALERRVAAARGVEAPPGYATRKRSNNFLQ
jgi:hypothetical protein